MLVFVWFLLSNGVKGGRSLTGGEEKELDGKTRIIRKLAIKTIKNEDVGTIDCVEFDKQPTFVDPLSNNNSIQATHISHSNDGRIPVHTMSKIALESAACPSGTVPIRRTTAENSFRLKSSTESGSGQITIANPLNSAGPPGVHYAALVSDKGSYRGANAVLEVHAISGVGLDQYSGTIIMMFSGFGGPPENFNVISAGWLVHPKLYGDNLPRLTIFWTTDGYQHTNCFNLQCPGFVQKSSNYSPGMSLGEGLFPLFIFKDKQTGDWCLSTSDGKTEELIGWWPSSIFTSLAEEAEFIEWGGTVMSALDQKSPPMGNGRFPLYGARVSLISTLDENNNAQDPKGRLVADRSECYNAAWFGNRPAYGWSFYYGGPGGCLG
ncbi:uncharacterized protein A4U43_C03F2080 [Asparagus officinalis]|uniref:Neprosin PEP catalytic domain-containing protein n=1 Tax=Asparagus officinalis TaxID=4686 RepID=A0A5P1FBM0_ASPOF|nr:uncharacterized protein A4U43_C03F2080 [Asparagus officinalis]